MVCSVLQGSPRKFLSYRLRAKSEHKNRPRKNIFKRSARAKRCVVWVKVLRMPNMLTELKLLLMFVSWLNSLASKIGLGGILYALLCSLVSEDDLWF